MPTNVPDESALIKFYHGNRDKIDGKVLDGTVNGSDFFVSADTDEFIFVDKQLKLHPLRFRTQKRHQVQLGESAVVGGFSEGDILEAGTDLDEFIERLFKRVVPPEYAAPEVKLTVKSGPQPGIYEAGTAFDIVVHAEYVQNDGGDIKSGKIYPPENGTDFLILPQDFNFSITLGHDEFDVYAEVEYQDGPVKKNNYGEESPIGRILAGSATSNKLIYRGVDMMFFGADSVVPQEVNVEYIRSLSGKSAVSEDKEDILDIPAGSRFVTIAVPQAIDIKVEYVDLGDTRMLDAFSESAIEINSLDGSGFVTYSLYTYKMAVPSFTGMTFKIATRGK